MSTGARRLGWILWAGTVGLRSSIAERLDAAAATGCRRVSLSPAEAIDGCREIAAQARDLELALVLDPVMNWYPSGTVASSQFAAISGDDALAIGERLGVVAMTVITTPGEPQPPTDLAARFGAVCDRAAGFGAEVQLEFIPFTSTRTLRQAWDVVAVADRPNGGVVFDTWHFHRGEPDYDLLAGMPGEKIFCVQLDDAPSAAPANLRAETHHRLLPGDGELDLVRDLRALDAIGALRWIGPEVINPDLEAMPVLAAATLAMRRSREVVTAALGMPGHRER